MTDAPPTSVLLPTVEWTDACSEVAAQLRRPAGEGRDDDHDGGGDGDHAGGGDGGGDGDGNGDSNDGPADELLIVCDDASDPVVDREGELPDGVRLVYAGEPVGCSGKSNAIAAGMAAADHDRIVWTDDDFHHPPTWLAELQSDYETQGSTTEIPFFVGRDPLATFLEPLYAIGGTVGVAAGKTPWAGAVIFDRADLDEAAFREDLERSVSDDGTLSEHLDVTPVRRVREVPVGGSLRATLERHVRFVKIVRFHDPRGLAVSGALALIATLAAILFPLQAFVGFTLLQTALYARFGVHRWTPLLAYPVVLAQLPLLAYGLARRTFVWGGRRYRWRGRYDVEVVDREAET